MGAGRLLPGAAQSVVTFLVDVVFGRACLSACFSLGALSLGAWFPLSCCFCVTAEAATPREGGHIRVGEAAAYLQLSAEIAYRLTREDFTQARIASGEQRSQSDGRRRSEAEGHTCRPPTLERIMHPLRGSCSETDVIHGLGPRPRSAFLVGCVLQPPN